MIFHAAQEEKRDSEEEAHKKKIRMRLGGRLLGLRVSRQVTRRRMIMTESEVSELSAGLDFGIVDPHVHYWSPSTHSWLKGSLDESAPKGLRRFAPIAKAFSPSDQRRLLAPLEIKGSAYVQANFSVSANPTEEAAYCVGVRLADGNLPSVFTSYAPLSDPEAAEKVLEASRRYEGFRGVRFMLDYHPTRPELSQTDRGDYMADPNFRKGLGLLSSKELFELQVCQCQLLEAANFVSLFPEITFVLNHAGFPLRGDFQDWKRGIDALAANPKVVVKIGGLGCYDEPNWSQDEVNDYANQAVSAFGLDRSMFASNLPVDLLDFPDPRHRYLSLLRAAKHAGFSSPDDLRRLFRTNAARIYSIDL